MDQVGLTEGRLRAGRIGRVVLICCMVLSSLATAQQEPLPNISLPTLAGERRALRDLLGRRMTLLVFWATWGKDSGQVIEDLARIDAEKRGDGVSVVGICVDSQQIGPEVIKAAKESLSVHRASFPMLVDSMLTAFRAAEVVAVPTVLAVDAELHIVKRFAGYGISVRDALEDYVTVAIGGPAARLEHRAQLTGPARDAALAMAMARKDLARGRHIGAAAAVEKALRVDPTLTESYELLASIAWEMQDTVGIRTALTRAASAAADPGRLSEWRSYLDSSAHAPDTVLMGKDIGALCRQADRRSMAGDHAWALRCLDTARVRQPEDYRPELVRSWVLQRLGQLEEARNVAKRVRVMRRP